MKRDMDLVRAILLDIEKNNVFQEDGYTPQIPGYSLEEIAYHVQIMEDADLLLAHVQWFQRGPPRIYLARMAWKGHEFLDASRNESLWNQAKEKVFDATGGIGFEALKALLIQLGAGS